MKNMLKSLFLVFLILGTISSIHAETNGIIRRGKIKRKSISSYKVVVVVGKKAGDIASATATIAVTDKESPQPTLKSFEMDVSKNKKGNYLIEADLVCEKSLCLFDKKDNPLGETYTLTLTFKDTRGKPIGGSESINAEVELDKSVCVTKQKIDNITFVGLNLYYSNTKSNTNSLLLITPHKVEGDFKAIISWSPSLGGKIQCTSPPAMDLVVEYSLPNEKTTHTYTTRALYNNKTHTYTANWVKVDSAYTHSFWIRPTGSKGGWRPIFSKPQTITSSLIVFATKKAKEQDDSNNDETDSTTNNYVIDNEVKLDSKVIGKLQVLSLSEVKVTNQNKLSKEIPSAKAIIYLKACDGKKVNIAITLKYDSKSKTFLGNQGLPLCNSKAYDVESITVTVWDNGGTLWTRTELTHL